VARILALAIAIHFAHLHSALLLSASVHAADDTGDHERSGRVMNYDDASRNSDYVDDDDDDDDTGRFDMYDEADYTEPLPNGIWASRTGMQQLMLCTRVA
jgi:hypothetical protein